MDNNNGEENAQQQQLAIMQENEDGICMPNWLLEVFAWITRIQMANSSLSYSCKLFKLLCWPKLHENVEPYKIDRLEFLRDLNIGYLQLNRTNGQQLAIPTVPPPPYILGFEDILMHFLNEQLLEFVQLILPLLNPINFSVEVGSDGWMRDDKKINAFGRLLDLLADKIVQFNFRHSARIFEFNQLFLGFINKVNFLCASESPTPEEFVILFDWLTLPPPTNADKQQKILQFERQPGDVNKINKFIDRIKEEFSNSTAPRNFFISRRFGGFYFAHLNMENEKTGEILTVTEEMHIIRCPKGEENYWNEEGENKTTQWWIGHKNETYIDFFVIP